MKLYKKVQHGKRTSYEEVGDSEIYYPHREGCYLVRVRKNYTQILHQVNPDYAVVEAALQTVKDALIAKLNETNTFQPDTREMSAVEIEFHNTLAERLGYQPRTVYTGVSMNELVEAGLAVLREALEASDK